MAGTIYHTCSKCGKGLYPKDGPRSNGDTIREFVVAPCECATAKIGELVDRLKKIVDGEIEKIKL